LLPLDNIKKIIQPQGFFMSIEKEEDPKGDRIKVIMNGKFLPYKKW
jgi:cyanate lyase